MTLIIGHHYRLNATRFPGRIYRCISIESGQVNLMVVKHDPSETIYDVAMDSVRFEANATETEFP
jgi:hypothetical protein